MTKVANLVTKVTVLLNHHPFTHREMTSRILGFLVLETPISLGDVLI